MAENYISERVKQGIMRLSQPKQMYHFKNENIQQGSELDEVSPIVRRARLYCLSLATIKQPIYPNELIIGDVPYHEFTCNKELLPALFSPDEDKKLYADARKEYHSITGEEPENFNEMSDFFKGCVNYGHLIANYEMLLAIGFKGMIARIGNPGDNEFLLAAKLSLEGGSAYITRYADKAARLAETIEDDKEKNVLKIIEKNSRHIAFEPPETFWQAVQLLWFLQLLMEVESGISAFSYGRADIYLSPFLQTDIAAGRVKQDEAQEIMDCFFIKNNEHNSVTQDAGRALTVGGVTADGSDAVNEVTYLMVNSTIRLKLFQPKLSARIHKKSPDEYIRLCAKGAALNTGIQVYNDDVILKILEIHGYSPAEAIDYGIIGCYEYGLSGVDRSSPMSSVFHLAACLEQVLHTDSYDSYEELEALFAKCVAHWANKLRLSLILEELVCRRVRPLPFLSNFVEDCISSKKDINNGGARYKTCGVRFTGFSAVADSLTAIKTLVFEENVFTKEQVLTALKNNFTGSEQLRLTLLDKAPKYGNDNDVADAVAVKVGEICCEEILRQTHIDGEKLKPGLFSFLDFLEAGKSTGALPNGRKAGESFVNGVSPTHGADISGATAMLASAAKLNYTLSPNGTTLDLRLLPSAYSTPDGFDLLVYLIRGYFNMGGAHIQTYTLSEQELEAAKKNPEKYRNIIVRVTGYSAYFVSLNSEMQDEIIKRTESVCKG